ncbi:unnamed protein product [Adineta steineri]|uniref:Uncharacterized protein n=1 Tax=Adineta steineri TaxID=433720 RepID=A0A814S8I7_9BILA|nr:unnamed protein product [Adineta steineri]
MDFHFKSYNYDPNRTFEIEKTLVDDGYVRIQFFDQHVPHDNDFPTNMEKFLIDIIEKLDGESRSQTDDEFLFHTDCSYEINPPEYMALFVLEPDQFGGGQLEIIQLSDILQSLSIKTREKLSNENFRINIPLEFRKLSKQNNNK